MKVSFSPPRIDQKIIDGVSEALRSGWITTGPKTKLFEARLAEYTGVQSVLCLNSATAGLELALRWFGVKEGDEVILPVYTYAATANVIVHCGAVPVFVDVNADDFNINVEKLIEHITNKTKVIMPVDFGGLPCDYKEIMQLVNSDKIRGFFKAENEIQQCLSRIMVLEDAAHSIGASYRGKKVGCLADLTVISFHAVKNLTTAEGGAVCFNLPRSFDNFDVHNLFSIKSLHGQNKDALAKTKPGYWKYDIIEAGYKYNMTDIVAAIGLIELERYEQETLLRRKEIVTRYNKFFSQFHWAVLPIVETENKRSSYHLYPLRIRNCSEKQRDEIIQMIAQEEVAVNVHFIPVPMLSFYKKKGYSINDYPVAYSNYACEISLPVFYDLEQDQLSFVCRTVAIAVNKILANSYV